ncbi:gamma-glutamyltransferase [Paenibacillus sp. V4I7]|uniref:gamma-glutamyltransferase n=1 Tax=Paenibacillus sp. V4I7 TaxID=3042307 RepID=UPI00277FA098|nr:gamma-glutamyltransferase [Paenibacillus sp. V4I7]MDQ0902104.1 gamma-glutamyltranspeptidase [Paenibacillus sp. V4I7]
MVRKHVRSLICATLTTILVLSTPTAIFADRLPWYQQSPVATGTGGAAATEHPLASQAAMDILNSGGNAVEAAIAAAAVHGVVRPFSGGIGGGGYMHIYLKDQNKFVVLDHRTTAGSSFGAHSFLDTNGIEYAEDIRDSSGPSAGVPGVVKAWEKALQEHGTGKTLSELLQPAIQVAENGFYADDNFIREITENAPRFRAYQSTIDLYLNPDGSVPPVGTLMQNPDLANTYRLIAQHGSSKFYNGEIGQAVVDAVYNPPVVANPPYQVIPGDLTLSDFQNYNVLEYAPVKVNYRGYDIYAPPPSSSGGTTVGQTLNILEGYNMGTIPRDAALHYFIEASRYAFADRKAYLGDPATYTGTMPVTGLLSKNYAERVRQNIGDIGTQRLVEAGDPWPYDANPNLPTNPIPAAGKHTFSYNFAGIANGSTWDSTGKFITAKGGNGTVAIHVQNETGNMQISGSKNAYVRAQSVMAPISDSELLVKFKMNELTGNRSLRFWLRADSWNSTTVPNNGYGVELNTNTDSVKLIRAAAGGQITTIATFAHTRITDWQWLRFRVEDNQLQVRIWNNGVNEPREDWKYSMQDSQVTGTGKLLLSAIALSNGSLGGSFNVDDIHVTDLHPLAFSSNFNGVANGSSWDSTGLYTTQLGTGASNPGVGAQIDVQSETGRIYLDKTQFAYARAESSMNTLSDSELLVKFKMNELTNDRNLRFWLRADGWNSTSAPHNGYGVEIKTNSDKVRILRTRQSNGAFALTEINHPRTTDWQWLRFSVEGNVIRLKIWKDGEVEPVGWLHQRTNSDVVAPGKFLLSAVELTGGTGVTGGSFQVDDMQVFDLDVFKNQGSTIHLSVSDSDGNIVSYTSTINSIGGNGIVVPGYGFLLNNDLATRVPSNSPVGAPNGPRPGMRALSSMSPTIVMKDGIPVMALGSPGGETIITSVVQVLLNRLDFGMTLPQAVAAPRLSQRNHSFFGNTLIEAEFQNAVEYQQLLARGQQLFVTSGVEGIGAVNAIEFFPNGEVQAVSEPSRRGGGSAMVQNP